PEMVRRGRVVEHRFEGYWRDVGTIESYWLAHRDLLAAEPAIRLDDPAWPILSYGVQRRPAWIAGSARIDGSLISPGCQVRGEVVRSIIAPGATIGVGAVVRDTILLHDARVESGARVDAAILDERVRVGSGARVGQPLAGRDRESDGGGQLRIMVAGCGAVIPDGATVEAGALITPPG
ncbi:MAG TPA: glucose-1-phosphate adenylyltransferase, partial [Dehalococcoidia bacterium]|nr:glucose-1-phosphate adenylyltransferase [Dehalococcoidia bacterium]